MSLTDEVTSEHRPGGRAFRAEGTAGCAGRAGAARHAGRGGRVSGGAEVMEKLAGHCRKLRSFPQGRGAQRTGWAEGDRYDMSF